MAFASRSGFLQQGALLFPKQRANHFTRSNTQAMELIAARDPLCRFYTLPHIGDLLIDLMASGPAPRRLIDLGAGTGTLARAARRRWSHAEIVTIDVDESCGAPLREQLRRHIHHTHDALDPNLPQLVAPAGPISATICNPPYIRPKWRSGFERVLEEAGLLNAFGSPSDVTSDALFLAQSMRLTATGGKVGLIVPDGIITGIKAQALRRVLLNHHGIECVVQLPRSSFKDAEVQAFLLIFKNRATPRKQVRLMRYDPLAGLRDPIAIQCEQAEHRMDYAFHAYANSPGHRSLRSLGATVSRGTISATVARSTGLHVFHTTDFGSANNGHFEFPITKVHQTTNTPGLILAEQGDILLARVDRNLHRKIGFVVSGCVPISDCIYRIRVPSEVRETAFSALRSDAGAKRIFGAARGVGARQLSKRELLELPIIPNT